jgi:hypothetical protein
VSPVQGNPEGQTTLASTILPLPSGVGRGSSGAEEEHASFGSILVRALVANRGQGDLEASCRAAGVLLHILKDNAECKERVSADGTPLLGVSYLSSAACGDLQSESYQALESFEVGSSITISAHCHLTPNQTVVCNVQAEAWGARSLVEKLCLRTVRQGKEDMWSSFTCPAFSIVRLSLPLLRF